MITFNNIVERFEDFATSHFFIKSFSFGSPDDVDLAKFTEFPLMHLVYTGATYDSGTKTYNIEVYILDVPADKNDKVERQREVVSDAEQCAEDIIADIRMGGNIFTFAQDYEVVNATTTPLEEETKNVLSGVLLDLSVAIPYEWDACNAPIDGVSPEGGTEPSYARRGFLRMLEIDGTPDILSVRTIKVTNGTLTDDGDGVVTLDTGGVETLEDLTDTNIISPSQGSVISYNTGVQKWMVNNGLQELLQKFKASGTGAQMYDTLNDTTKGYIDILAASATMKVNHSGMTISEASPGIMSFTVAAGTEGNEVEFEAMTIEGSDAVSTVADINFKQGSLTYWENSTGKIWLRAPNAGNITVLLPSSGGTLALTTDIPNVPVDSVNGQTGVVVLDTGDIDENGNLYYTEARVAANSAVAANTAKVGITTQQAADITANNAKTGITPTQASEITANTAKVGITTQQADDITANNAKTGITAQQATDITTNNAKVGIIAGGTTGQALVKASGTDYDTEWADISIDTQYHDRFQTDAETFRSGATDTVELYYTAKADGDGLAESAESDTPTAGKIIKRKIYYSEAAFADPDTGTWVEFTPAPADDASFATVKAALLEYLKARTGGTVPISLKQTWEEVTSVQYLLDKSFGSGAEAAYSTRQLRNAQTDCMVIRRASDGTTQTIGFDGSGNIDESAITTFCTGTTCTVSEWKDQSGNGNHATQSTAGNQPTIYTGGAIVKENGKPCIKFNVNHLISSAWMTQLAPMSFTLIQTPINNSRELVIGVDTSTPYTTAYHNWSSSGGSGFLSPRLQSFPANSISTSLMTEDVLNLVSSYASTTAVNFYTNGSISAESPISHSNTSAADGAITIGSPTSYNPIRGSKISEVLFWLADKSTARTDIEENIGDYFTQNTPLLDTYTGAAAAYSLRKLRTAYTGDAVEVYNGSSYADIGFNVFGELDTVALAAHCGSNDGFIRTWYDQSGSGNDATQSTTSNMPKIYDGTTGVVTENGKPAAQTTGAFLELSSAVSSIVDVFTVAKETGTDSLNYLLKSSLDSSLRSVFQAYRFFTSSSGDWPSTATYKYYNGSTPSSNPSSTTQALVYIGGGSRDFLEISTNFSGRDWEGNIQEIILYPSDQSSNRTGMENNINTFYDIF